jgi:hypothetical protein
MSMFQWCLLSQKGDLWCQEIDPEAPPVASPGENMIVVLERNSSYAMCQDRLAKHLAMRLGSSSRPSLDRDGKTVADLSPRAVAAPVPSSAPSLGKPEAKK